MTDKHHPMSNAKQELHARVEHDLTYHQPPAHVGEVMEQLRGQTLNLAHHYIDVCPVSRDLSMALTHLEEAQRSAIAALAKES